MLRRSHGSRRALATICNCSGSYSRQTSSITGMRCLVGSRGSAEHFSDRNAMTNLFKVHVMRLQRHAIMRCWGEIDILRVPILEATIDDLITIGSRRPIADLRAVTFMDCSRLNALAREVNQLTSGQSA
jgi:hypothetical protein